MTSPVAGLFVLKTPLVPLVQAKTEAALFQTANKSCWLLASPETECLNVFFRIPGDDSTVGMNGHQRFVGKRQCEDS